MKKLLELRLGGRGVKPGLLPVDSLELIRELLAAIKEEGGNLDDWRTINAHVEVLGPGSTRTAIHAERVSSLRRPTAKFVRQVKKHRPGPKGRAFVINHFRPESQWTYAEIYTGDKARKHVRIDRGYRDEILREPRLIYGSDQIYGRVVRVGGDAPPRVALDIAGMDRRTYDVSSLGLARTLAGRLYETAKLEASVVWEADTLSVRDMKIVGIDEAWEDVHLSDVVEQNGGRLPITLTVGGVEELVSERDEDEL